MNRTMAGILSGFVLLAACNNEASTTTTPEDNLKTVTEDTVPATKTVPAETDENGCKVASGERWSMIRKTCIVMDGTGIRIDPKEAALDKTRPAYLLFSDDRVRVEIFLPTQKKSVVIRKVSAANEPERWANGPLTVKLTDGVYSLDDEGKLLYEGPTK